MVLLVPPRVHPRFHTCSCVFENQSGKDHRQQQHQTCACGIARHLRPQCLEVPKQSDEPSAYADRTWNEKSGKWPKHLRVECRKEVGYRVVPVLGNRELAIGNRLIQRTKRTGAFRSRTTQLGDDGPSLSQLSFYIPRLFSCNHLAPASITLVIGCLPFP